LLTQKTTRLTPEEYQRGKEKQKKTKTPKTKRSRRGRTINLVKY
jgi:hypothetical protein